VVLASFGGVGLRGLPLARVAAAGSVTVVTTDDPSADREPQQPLTATTADGLMVLHERRLYEEGFRYEDVVAAADVVITKPGYGIVSECVANQTALLYTERGRFAEYDALVTAMPRWVRCRFMGREEFFARAGESAVQALLAQSPPPAVPDLDGAEVAAKWMDDLLRSGVRNG
jgi:hypothetical protein